METMLFPLWQRKHLRCIISNRSLTSAPGVIELVCRKTQKSGKTKRIWDKESAYQVVRNPQTQHKETM